MQLPLSVSGEARRPRGAARGQVATAIAPTVQQASGAAGNPERRAPAPRLTPGSSALRAGSPARRRCLSERARAPAGAIRWIGASHPPSSALPATFLRSPTPGTQRGTLGGQRSAALQPLGKRAEPAACPPLARPGPARRLRGGVAAAAPPQVARVPARRRPGAPGRPAPSTWMNWIVSADLPTPPPPTTTSRYFSWPEPSRQPAAAMGTPPSPARPRRAAACLRPGSGDVCGRLAAGERPGGGPRRPELPGGPVGAAARRPGWPRSARGAEKRGDCRGQGRQRPGGALVHTSPQRLPNAAFSAATNGRLGAGLLG